MARALGEQIAAWVTAAEGKERNRQLVRRGCPGLQPAPLSLPTADSEPYAPSPKANSSQSPRWPHGSLCYNKSSLGFHKARQLSPLKPARFRLWSLFLSCRSEAQKGLHHLKCPFFDTCNSFRAREVPLTSPHPRALHGQQSTDAGWLLSAARVSISLLSHSVSPTLSPSWLSMKRRFSHNLHPCLLPVMLIQQ